MSIDGEEADLRLKVKRWFLSQFDQFREIGWRLMELWQNPRRIFSEIKNSGIMRRLILALLLSEVIGTVASDFSLSIASYITGVLPLSSGQEHFQVTGALALNYKIANGAFYLFWLILGWDRYRLYGLRTALVDLVYFVGLDTVLQWLMLFSEGTLANSLVATGFSKSSSVYIAYVSHIFPATFLFALAALPVVTAYEKRCAFVKRPFERIVAIRQFLNKSRRRNYATNLTIRFGRAIAKILTIELAEWLRLYCIQPRAGPRDPRKDLCPTKSVGLFLFKTDWIVKFNEPERYIYI